EWGMSKELGPMTFGKHDEQIFLGRDIAQTKDYSEHTAIEIDREVRRVVDEAYQSARTILSESMPLLHAVAERLLEKEVLDGSEVAAMVKAFNEGRPLSPQPAASPPDSNGNLPGSPAKDKPKQPEDAPAPALPPKPVLA
ncbi:MAG: ATP-dependent zinc metalloprotease FtsH, partial [Candidatus Binataceae bacterium]